jgi:hypothetical protein
MVWIRLNSNVLYKIKQLTWVARLQQMLDECCFPCRILTQEHNHWLCIEITACLENGSKAVTHK